MATKKTYVVEHLDPECGPWSTLEYLSIAKESADSDAQFCLSSAPSDFNLPPSLRACRGLEVDHRSVEQIYHDCKDRVCLLDPAAKEELGPKDAEKFDVFVFGGILASLDDISYVDYPEIRIDEHESTEMPFRYVKDAEGKPTMPEGMIDLIKKDSEKGFGDLF
ncbi:MAG: hypothetical protein Q9196_004949 [Gyalolechia fulgens]